MNKYYAVPYSVFMDCAIEIPIYKDGYISDDKIAGVSRSEWSGFLNDILKLGGEYVSTESYQGVEWALFLVEEEES